MPETWLVVIDPQRIFASPDSPWGSPMFPGIVDPVHRLAEAHAGRTVLTRWVAPDPARGSWAPYLDAWPFARVPADDRLYDLVDEVRDIEAPVVTATTFGKWVPDLVAITGETPHLVVAGVSTDCCVVSTALAAADAGATLTVVTDACAGSTPDNHRSALDVMALYPPQITLATTAERPRVRRVIHTGQALVDVVVEVPSLPRPRPERDGRFEHAVRRGLGQRPRRRGPLRRRLRARRRPRDRAQRRPGPGLTGRRGRRALGPGDHRPRHGHLPGARRAVGRADLRDHPGRRAGDQRRVAVHRGPGGGRPGLRDRLLAGAARDAGPAARLAARPSTRAWSSCSTRGRPSPTSRRRSATRCWSSPTCGRATPRRRPTCSPRWAGRWPTTPTRWRRPRGHWRRCCGATRSPSCATVRPGAP